MSGQNSSRAKEADEWAETDEQTERPRTGKRPRTATSRQRAAARCKCSQEMLSALGFKLISSRLLRAGDNCRNDASRCRKVALHFTPPTASSAPCTEDGEWWMVNGGWWMPPSPCVPPPPPPCVPHSVPRSVPRSVPHSRHTHSLFRTSTFFVSTLFLFRALFHMCIRVSLAR